MKSNLQHILSLQRERERNMSEESHEPKKEKEKKDPSLTNSSSSKLCALINTMIHCYYTIRIMKYINTFLTTANMNIHVHIHCQPNDKPFARSPCIVTKTPPTSYWPNQPL